jgi:putative ABC transport system permease protein
MTAALGIPPPALAAWVAGGVGLVVLVLLGFAAANRVLLRMALRNLPRRRAQTALIVVGLMLATLIITAALSVGDTLSYSLQSIELKQLGGIDQAVSRQTGRSPAGAGTTDADFFTAAQAATVIDSARSDPNVGTAAGVLVAPAAVSDADSRLASSENVVAYGVGADFDMLWGGLRSRGGGSLAAGDLAAGDVYLGSALADRLNARPGDHVQLVLQGRTVAARVRDVLDTEVNPTIAQEGPIVGSVLVPLGTMRTALGRPSGFNLVYVHDRGTGGLDDLGPGGSSGQEVVRHLRSAFIDQQAAADLWAYLHRPAIHDSLRSMHGRASFIDPSRQLEQDLLTELAKPAMTDQFKALVGDSFDDRLIRQAAMQSAGGNGSQARLTEVDQLLQSLDIDSGAAARLRDVLQTPAVRQRLTAAAGASGGELAQALRDLLAEPAQGPVSPRFKVEVTAAPVRTPLRAAVAAAAPAQLARFDQAASALQLDVVTASKADGVLFAQESGLVATGALLGVSFFSLAVGVLLIFLIFVMLAAERRAEMGMSRAVGLKRRHLTQMFLFEGFAYTLVAGVAGVLLGLVVGKLMIGVISSIFSGLYKGLDLIYHVEWPTLVIALCLGIALTFVVVAVSAYRVSRLNIVAAIRDLDEGGARPRGLGRVWAFLRRGPLALALGLLAAAGGLASESEILYGAGASLLVIGAGLLVRWALGAARVRQPIADRIGFTAAALGLLVYWGRPFGRVETLLHLDGRLQLAKLDGGPEVFALTALMVLLGAIWAVMYNSDLLIRAGMLVTGRAGGLAASARTSMAYPMSTRFRTGMAVAMFAIVTFMIAYMAIFKDVLTQNFTNVSAQSGGWQLVAGTPDQNFDASSTTALPANVAATVRADPTASREVRAIGWENESLFVTAREPGARAQGATRQNAFPVHVVDDGYLNGTGYAIQPRAAGYGSDRAVWDAIRDHVGYAVIDTSVTVAGIDPHQATFTPFQLDLSVRGESTTWRVTVIGFLTRPIWGGMYVSTRTAQAGGMLGSAPPVPTGYYFSVAPGADANRTRIDLGRLLVGDQLEAVSVADQQAQSNGAIITLLNLLTGFLALGLIVGIAGLGVISTRTVVERRQQIGMMRAIGYRRSHVQRSFLMESSFVALLGLLIGGLVGLWQSYQFFVTQRTLGDVVFHVPVLELVLILLGSYAATLLTTYLPARAAARVAPAEALRFE